MQQTSTRANDDQATPMPGSRAIVVGGSMAGLLAARVLADHFERVTIVERDRFPETPAPRKGVPQARHVHLLLLEGQHTLELLFPGLADELSAAGAPSVDLVADFPVYGMSGWSPRVSSSFIACTCSRDLLEWTVRRRLAASANVETREDRQVTGLFTTPDRTRVTGVLARVRDGTAGDDATTEEYSADLVIDASGRDSRAPRWLEALGYAPPAESIVNSFLGYATRWYRRPDGAPRDWKGLLVGSKAPENAHSGVIFPVEGDRWVVTLGGMGHDYPPTDEAGFMAFARSLRSPLLYEAIAKATPLTPIYGYRRTENHLRHYEQLRRWPEGFVVLGDAACAFNPVYGQGMTTASLGAAALDRRLHDERRRGSGAELSGMGRRFQADLAGVTATPWLMATGEDFRWPTTEGGQPSPATRLMHRYMDGVMILSAYSPRIYQAFLEVLHLLKPPRTLFQPDIALHVLGWAISRPRMVMHAMPPRGKP